MEQSIPKTKITLGGDTVMMFETERLYIRKFRESDYLDMFEYFSDREVLKYEPFEPFSLDYCKEACISRSRGDTFYAVCLKETDKLIGNLCITVNNEEFNTWEIGYIFNKDFHGKGYASESVKGMIDYLMDKKGVRRIIAMCDPLNEPSWKLLERIGMSREAHFKKEIYFKKDESGNPIWKDTYVYAILNEKY